MFVQEFGLMQRRIDRVGYEGADLDVFEARLSFIHGHICEERAALMERAAERAGKDVMVAAERT